MSEPLLVTAREAAALLRISRAGLYRLLDTNPEFPRPIRITPRTVRFRRASLEAWLSKLSEAA